MNTIVQTGFSLGTAIISNGQITGNPWLNPNNLLLTTSDVAQSNPNNVASDVIIGNFNGAQVPSNAIITGVEVEIIGAYSGQPASPSITLTPYFVDDTSGQDVYYPYQTPQMLSITPTTYVLGSQNYLFATSFTPDQINNAKIALVANGNIYSSAVKLNIFYYIPFTPTPPSPTGNSCVDCNSPIQAPAFTLALPFKSGDRYAYFNSFNYADGTPIQYADLGSCGGRIVFTFDPGLIQTGNSNFMENAQTAIWTTLPNGTVQFDFDSIDINRGLMFHTPYSADEDLRSDHDANSTVIISDSGPFLGQYIQKCQIGAVVSAPIQVYQNNSLVLNPVTKFNFTGPGQQTTADSIDPLKVNVFIAGAAGTTPPVLVSTSNATSGNVQVGTLTWMHVSSGVNRDLTIQPSLEGGKTVSGITFNGVALTHVTDVTNNAARDEWWHLVGAPVGTFPIVITFSLPSYCSAIAESWVGVDQSTPIGTVQTATNTGFNPLLILTTTYDNSIIVDGLSTAQTPMLYTVGAGQVLNGAVTANADTRQAGSSYTLSGSAPDAVTMQYAITQNTDWAYCAVELKGITTAAPVVTGLTVQDVSGGTSVPNTSKIVFNTGTVTAPGGGQATVDVTKIRISATDTTPGFPLAKLVAGTGLTITQQNIAGNETLKFDNTGSGGNASLLASTQYLAIANSGQSPTAFGIGPVGLILTDTATTRILVPGINPIGGGFFTTVPGVLRVFKNDFGSFFQEYTLTITTGMLTQASSAFFSVDTIIWTKDSAHIYAIVRYRKTNATTYTAIDVLQWNIDGTGQTSANLYVATSTTTGDNIVANTKKGAYSDGTNLFLFYHQASGSLDQFREYTIGSYTSPANTYTLTGVTASGTGGLSFDSATSTFYNYGAGQSFAKYAISGSNFSPVGSAISYPELNYSDTTSDGGTTSIASVENFQSSSYTLYTIFGLQTHFSTSPTDFTTSWLLQGLTFAKI